MKKKYGFREPCRTMAATRKGSIIKLSMMLMHLFGFVANIQAQGNLGTGTYQSSVSMHDNLKLHWGSKGSGLSSYVWNKKYRDYRSKDNNVVHSGIHAYPDNGSPDDSRVYVRVYQLLQAEDDNILDPQHAKIGELIYESLYDLNDHESTSTHTENAYQTTFWSTDQGSVTLEKGWFKDTRANTMNIKKRMNSVGLLSERKYIDVDQLDGIEDEVMVPYEYQDIVIEMQVVNANVESIAIPGLTQTMVTDIFPTEFPPYNITISITNANGALRSEYYSSPNISFDGVIDVIMGDKVTFEVQCLTSDCSKPEILGIPDIWVTGFASSRAFICSPNLTPGEFNPFVPFEGQVHMYNLNRYPEDFEVNVPDWENSTDDDGNRVWTWSWTAERRTDPDKTTYKADVYFPPTKNFGYLETDDIQREDQSLGYAAMLTHYWKNNNVNNIYVPGAEAPEYLLPVDNDEVLYVGSTNVNTKDSWDGFGLAGPKIYYDDPGNPAQEFVNWQHMWEGESRSVTYDEHGYPSGGYVLNDYMTEYRKFKENARNNTGYDRYYDGYLIEDYGIWRQNNLKGNKIGGSDLPGKCAEGCKYNPGAIWQNLDGTIGNNKHPGQVSISIEGKETKIRMKVDPPLSEDKGFYGTIKGTNWPMGWGNETPYTLTGLKDLTDEERSRYSLALVAYSNAGHTYGMPPSDAEEVNVYGGTAQIVVEYHFDEDGVYNAETGEWTVDVMIDNGWSVIVAYYNTAHGKAIVAGRDLWVMDPLAQITVPGSKPYPFATEPVMGENEVDLKEGIGERVNEYITETRKMEDKDRGFASWGLKKHTREYVFRKGETVTFAATDVGTGKVEIFNSAGPPHLYKWRDLAKYMPPDTIAKNLVYYVNRLSENGFDTEHWSIDTQTDSRHFTYTWNETGIFEITANFMDMPYNNGSIKVTIVDDYPLDALDDLSKKRRRGSINIRALRADELDWLLSAGASPEDVRMLAVAEVVDVLSEYKYVSGPRATTYGSRFGSYNDFSEIYKWYSKDFHEPKVALTNPALDWYDNFDENSIWKPDWNKIWLRHTSSNHFPDEDIDKNDVVNDNTSTSFTEIMSEVFSSITSQSDFGPMRWLPWVAQSPSQGFKIARYVKPAVNLEEFFNGADGSGTHGAWSGDPDVVLPFLQDALEAETPFSDSEKNQLSLYYDLKYGRSIIIDITDVSDKNLMVFNSNNIPDHNNLPTEIYIHSKLVGDLSHLENEIPGDLSTITIEDLARYSYEVFESARSHNGMYYDLIEIENSEEHGLTPVSTSATGMALVALCIADKFGWIDNADVLVEETLNAVVGNKPGFNLSKSSSGFPVHWANWDGSESVNNVVEYSTIDAALLASGALFAKKYFNHNTMIAELSNQLFNSIDWSKTIENSEQGRIYMLMDKETGMGIDGVATSPFNEYMLVSYFAKEAETASGISGEANTLWSKFYEDIEYSVENNIVPHSVYDDYKTLSDWPGNFNPSFVFQFVYYLCHDFNSDEGFLRYFENQMLADKAYWRDQSGDFPVASYEWGLGEGSSPNEVKFSADAIGRNEYFTVSPHVLAGFSPINIETGNDLLSLLHDPAKHAVYFLDSGNPVLWRYSKLLPQWKSAQIQTVDWSTMLFGLSVLCEQVGNDFFLHHTNYDFPNSNQQNRILVDGQLDNDDANVYEFVSDDLHVYPNPAGNQIVLKGDLDKLLKITLYNSLGQIERSLVDMPERVNGNEIFLNISNLPNGLYILRVENGNEIINHKVVIE